MKKNKFLNKRYSAKTIRWWLNLFPPLFFNRIKIVKVDDDFCHIKVRIKYSIFNTNVQKSIFGGTIVSALDPFYAIMYWQTFSRMKKPMEVWIKKVDVQFKKPALSDLTINFDITQKDITKAKEQLKENDKYEVWHEVLAYDESDDIVSIGNILVHIRNSNKLNIN